MPFFPAFRNPHIILILFLILETDGEASTQRDIDVNFTPRLYGIFLKGNYAHAEQCILRDVASSKLA